MLAACKAHGTTLTGALTAACAQEMEAVINKVGIGSLTCVGAIIKRRWVHKLIGVGGKKQPLHPLTPFCAFCPPPPQTPQHDEEAAAAAASQQAQGKKARHLVASMMMKSAAACRAFKRARAGGLGGHGKGNEYM